MKNLNLLLCFFFSTTTLFSQYIPLPDAGASWSLQINAYTDEYSSFPYYRTGYKDFMNGDTLIDGNVYQKIYNQLTWFEYGVYDPSSYYWDDVSGNFENATSQLLGGLRQDTLNKKVYFRRLADITEFNGGYYQEDFFPLDEDVLLFDFDVEVGDTVMMASNSYVINSISTITYNDGISRKRYSAGGSFPDFNFIEGIGTDIDLFAPLRPTFVEGSFCYLNCFNIYENYIIGDGAAACDTVEVFNTPVVELENKSTINIYPNPFNHVLQIEWTSHELQNKTYQLELYNSLGQKVKTSNLVANQSTQLFTNILSTGIYYLTIRDQQKILTTQKITKQP